MASINLTINKKSYTVEVDPDTPLLWVLRDNLKLTGTKFGCGISQCGACTVHIDGVAKRSCITRVGTVAGKAVTTIEGLGNGNLHPLQEAWLADDVPQCGYCQPGQIMTAAALLAKNAKPSDDEIMSAMSRNLCRCGTYDRIRRAIARVVENGGAR